MILPLFGTQVFSRVPLPKSTVNIHFPPEHLSKRKQEFLETVDELLSKNLEARKSSKIEAFKAVWSKNKLARFALGVGLTTGAVVATSSGAFLVAGGLLGTRAAIGAIGGYLLSDSALQFLQTRVTTDKYVRLLAEIQSANKRSDIDPIVNSILADMEYEDFSLRISKAQENERRFKKINTVISGTVAATFAVFGGMSAAEAATDGLSKTSEVVSSTRSKTLEILHISNQSPPKIAISSVIEDVRHDHPGQNYVTLEQTVRRMEGLKHGIGLQESHKLKDINTSVYSFVRDSHGPIVQAMKELGILTSSQSVDDVAKTLSEKQIVAITEKAYGLTENTGDQVTKLSTLQTDSPSENVVKTQPVPIEKTPPDQVEEIIQGSTVETLLVSGTEMPKSSSYLSGKIIGTGIVGLGGLLGLAWFIRRKEFLKKKTGIFGGVFSKKSSMTQSSNGNERADNIPPQTTDSIHARGEIVSGNTLKNRVDTRVKTTAPGDIFNNPVETKVEDNIHDRSSLPVDGQKGVEPEVKKEVSSTQVEVIPEKTVLNPSGEESIKTEEVEIGTKSEQRIERFYRYKNAATEEFGFSLDLESSSKDEETGITFVFRKLSAYGEFVARYAEGNDGKVTVYFSWMDSGIEKVSLKRELTSTDDSREVFEKGFQASLLARDKVKNQELLLLRSFEMSESDLVSIYKQLEVPYVLENGTETGGYWFQSCYGMRDGVLKLENLANPTLEEMELTGVEFAVVGEKGSEYFARNKAQSLYKTFDHIEAKMLLTMQVNEYVASGSQKIVTMDGAVNYYNWHKHPGQLHHPSGMDMNDMGMGRGRFEKQPNLQVLTWGIANKLPSTITEANKPENAVILRGVDFGGKNDYILYFWKLHRNEANRGYKMSDLVPLGVRIV